MLISSLFASELDWSHDYKATLAQAQKENKDVYMLITSQDCKWCRKFESTTLQDKEMIKKLEKDYVLLHILREWDEIPEHFQSKRVPRHYFLTAKGEIIYSFLGYWNSEDFSSFLVDVAKKK